MLAAPCRNILKNSLQPCTLILRPSYQTKAKLGEEARFSKDFSTKMSILLQTVWNSHTKSSQHDCNEPAKCVNKHSMGRSQQRLRPSARSTYKVKVMTRKISSCLTKRAVSSIIPLGII